MGLLGRAETRSGHVGAKPGIGNIQAAIDDFQKKHSLFHCIVLQFADNPQQGLSDIAEMTAFHGADCLCLHGGNGLVLLPGALDMELFAHQLSQSTGSTVIFQFTADSSSLALETLSNYLQ